MNFNSIFTTIKAWFNNPLTRMAVIIVMLLPVAIIYFGKIKIWKPKVSAYRSRFRRYSRRRSNYRRRTVRRR